MCLLLFGAACGDSDEHAPVGPPDEPAEQEDAGQPEAPDEPDEPDAPELLVARGVFGNAADQERFEQDVLPSARAFLAHWALAGLDIVHGQARLFVSPPPNTPAREALPKLYGDAIFSALDGLPNEVAAAPTNEAALDVLDAFSCAHPPLHRSLLEERIGASSGGRAGGTCHISAVCFDTAATGGREVPCGGAAPAAPSSVLEAMLALTGVDVLRCPRCAYGQLVPVALPAPAPAYRDSS